MHELLESHGFRVLSVYLGSVFKLDEHAKIFEASIIAANAELDSHTLPLLFEL